MEHTTEELSPEDVVRRRVAALRRKKGKSQADLAEDMNRLGFPNWSRFSVSTLERGERRISIDELVAIAMALGEPINALLDPVGLPTVRLIPSRSEEADGVFWSPDTARRFLTSEMRIELQGVEPGADPEQLRFKGYMRKDVLERRRRGTYLIEEVEEEDN